MSGLHSSLVALFAALLCILPASAQTIDIRTLALRGGDMPEVHVMGPKGHFPLKFSAVQPTETVRALSANPLPLYRSETAADGKPEFIVAHQVKVPNGARGILLLAWSVGDEARYLAINDDFAAAGYNDWLLINTSARQIAFKVGETGKPILLNPGVSATHRISVTKGTGATVLAQAPINGKNKIFYSTYWPVHAEKRSVVLFADDGPKIIVKRISDQLAGATPDEEAGR